VLCVLSLYEVSPSEVVNSFTAPKYPFSVLRGVFCQIKRLMKLLDAPDPFGLTPFPVPFWWPGHVMPTGQYSKKAWQEARHCQDEIDVCTWKRGLSVIAQIPQYCTPQPFSMKLQFSPARSSHRPCHVIISSLISFPTSVSFSLIIRWRQIFTAPHPCPDIIALMDSTIHIAVGV
jgi:hypothetical protein